MQIFGFIGHSGSGKTTLVTALIRRFLAAGRSVCAVKHTHHDVGDLRGGDSERLLEAGASPVLLAGSSCWRITNLAIDEHPAGLLGPLILQSGADVVLVEGFKSATGWPRIALVASAHDALVEGCIAIITDDGTPSLLPSFQRNDHQAIFEFLDRIVTGHETPSL